MVMTELAAVVDVTMLRTNKVAWRWADPVRFLEAGQTSQLNGYYSTSLPPFRDDALDWELVEGD